MKKINRLGAAFLVLGLWACSDNDSATDPVTTQENVRIDGISAQIEGHEETVSTRAVSEYIVNKKDEDPTVLPLPSGREDWLLDVQIYDGNVPYPYGKGTLEYVAANTRWQTMTGDSIFFPNYLTQQIACRLYPPGFTAIALDQNDSNGDLLVTQDVLIQNGDNTVRIDPSHEPVIRMKHAHSMFDLRLMNVDETRISSIKLEVDGTEYTPYKTSRSTPEYLLIVPVGSSGPLIRVVTTDGAQYEQTVEMEDTTLVNTCYCFTLIGLELTLSPITVVDWVTGEAMYAQYTAVTAYPTFRGPAGEECTLFFDNDLSQTITFNDRGEATVKPAGRTLVRIVVGGRVNTLNPPIVLRNMIIDLTQEIAAAV